MHYWQVVNKTHLNIEKDTSTASFPYIGVDDTFFSKAVANQIHCMNNVIHAYCSNTGV